MTSMSLEVLTELCSFIYEGGLIIKEGEEITSALRNNPLHFSVPYYEKGNGHNVNIIAENFTKKINKPETIKYCHQGVLYLSNSTIIKLESNKYNGLDLQEFRVEGQTINYYVTP